MKEVLEVIPDGPGLKLARVAVMVPELLVSEFSQVVVVTAVVPMVKALHIPCAHHGHQGRLEHIRLLYELVVENVSRLRLLLPHNEDFTGA